MKAIHLSLQHWSNTLANTVVMIESDNSTTVSYLNKQGGDAVKAPVSSHVSDPDFLRRYEHQYKAPSYPRKTERVSRSAVKGRSHHLDTSGVLNIRSFSANPGDLGNTAAGPVCHQGQPSAAKVRLTLPRPRGPSGGRIFDSMDESVGLRVPAIRLDSDSLTEDTARSGRTHSGRTTLTGGQVVHTVTGTISRYPQATPGTSGPATSGLTPPL